MNESEEKKIAGRKIEQKAIIIDSIVCLIMAVAGWITYYISGSEAILLDGNFSFIGTLAALITLKISSIKTKTNKTYPFGQFVYESAYSLCTGLLTIGVIIAAGAENFLKIVNYIQGERYLQIDTSIISIYTITMVIFCFSLAILFWFSNRKLDGNSSMLGAYTVQSVIDGLLSAGAGIALVLFSLVPSTGSFGFLTQIGDAIVVLILCFLVVAQPIKLIKNSFIELSGGALNDTTIKSKICSIILNQIQNEKIANIFISKTGSSYLVIAFMEASFFDIHSSQELLKIKRNITQNLAKNYTHIFFELVLAEDGMKKLETY